MSEPKGRSASYRDKVTVFDHVSNTNKTVTLYEVICHVVGDRKEALALLKSEDVDVTLKLKRDGTVYGVLLEPKKCASTSGNFGNTSSQPDASNQADQIEENIKNASDKMESLAQKMDIDPETRDNSSDEEEDYWWKSKPKDEENELDLMLDSNEESETDNLDDTLIPDMLEATQLPPQTTPEFPKKPEEGEDLECQKPDPTTDLQEERNEDSDSDDDDEAWKDCWNCNAPKAVEGIYRGETDRLRLQFCCEKPWRIKPSNEEIEWGPKNYPYDSWVNHGWT